jgi:hypothetical protein
VPSELHGRLVVGILACWCGDLDEGERVLRPMRAVGPPLFDGIAARPLLEQQAMLDPSYPHGLWAYVKACDVPALTDEVTDVAIEHARRIGSPRSGVIFWQLGGAAGRVDPDGTAFGSRGSGHIVNITAATDGPEGFERERAWARRFHTALAPFRQGVYVNFLMDEGDVGVRESYGRLRLERLQRLKRLYDPENVFRLNQNISPA